MMFRMVNQMVVCTAGALILLAASAFAEIPNEFKNLEVFPKDIGKRELVDAMKNFSTALGVRCTHCHVLRTPGDYDTMDWASEEKRSKETTREMMRMVGRINSDMLPKYPGADARRVNCMTCHRGLLNPATLDRVLVGEAEKHDAEAAVAKYRELHAEHYGSGSYDFSPSTLHEVAESMAENKDASGARKVLELNLEMYPKDVTSLVLIAQTYIQEGDTAKARASLDRALEIDPENGYAKRMLAGLGEG